MTELTSRLTDQQLKVLYSELHKSRVGKNPKGFNHVQQWDVRRFLIRVFGFGGYDTELKSIECVREIERPAGKDDYGNPKFRYTVVYRVHQRLTVKDIAGRPIASFEGVATGDSRNQPSLGDAHDGAVKEADSQSLKRAAINLGDAFGLSLYNGGKTEPVVLWSAAHPHLNIKGPVGSDEAKPEDPPVEAEPGSVPGEPDTDPAPPANARPAAVPDPTPPPSSTPPQQPRPGAMPAAGPQERQAALDAMWDAARQANFTEGLPDQFAQAFGHPIEQGTVAEFRQARDLMVGSAAA
ncbi:Rad52/Rad22 family DNA repair protein [Streptomyces sp. NBC_00582]|uniref:Rad52/Rad22 family DNA repair protein n=1 Tax=Streptomyces sp. NBC_00582 TaxID=2975783 RepID=UPI002E809DE6|nr:Rad52/Rad22 family DNA repair protein [Streptomyces sp. NBC_00582]WUB63851.1 RAD52 family DNA repair protein [Streptomyces sp. NBC_00582]